MTYLEQYNWLKANGFIEHSGTYGNLIIWQKELLDNRMLQFSWHNHVPDWQLIIYGDKDDKFNSDVFLVDSIPSDADFTQFQPLIDIIK